jgi:hypothetical protein
LRDGVCEIEETNHHEDGSDEPTIERTRCEVSHDLLPDLNVPR